MTTAKSPTRGANVVLERKRRGSAIDHSDSDAQRTKKSRGDTESDTESEEPPRTRRRHHASQTQSGRHRTDKGRMRAFVEPSESDEGHSPSDSESGLESITRRAPLRSPPGAGSERAEAQNRDAFNPFNEDIK